MGTDACGCGGGSSAPRRASAPLIGTTPDDPLRGPGSTRLIPALDTSLTWRDLVGGWLVRWGVGRMRYRVEPGLYRVGQPGRHSPVLVTANYKLSVDVVRSALAGLDVWLLVLDTHGVNVWCAAGKGTFGTAELVRRIQETNLADVVDHRRIILPQLGAVGVAAHEVKPATGFSVGYGPVLARDIPAYLADRMRATPAMRRVPFRWTNRLVLAPMELAGAAKPALGILLALVALDVIRHGHVSAHAFTGFLPYLGAILVGGVMAPLLLPWLPSRSFALKGACLGLLWAAGWLWLAPTGLLDGASVILITTAIVSFMTLTFTGATTFTTLSGVRLEMRYAVPALITTAGAGILFAVLGIIR